MIRTYVRADLKLDGSWRIGSWDSDAANILGTLKDHKENPVVPGSGIAGMLRAAFGDSATGLLGRAPDDATKDDTREVSPWWILGTVTAGVDPETKPAVATRRRTRIDRRRKASARHGLFDTEEVSGGKVTIYFRADNVDPKPFLKLLAACNPRIGGGRTIGLGAAELTGIRYRTIEFGDGNDEETKQAFLDFLTPYPSPIDRVDRLLDEGKNYEFTSPSRTPLLTANMTVDRLAITDRQETHIHGSTMKGILRSRVEFIGRSMGYAVCGARDEDTGDWTGCGECAVCVVFGYSGKPGKLEFATAKWTSDQQDSEPKERVRIAIDRFTGGTRSGAWFKQQYLENVTWKLEIFGSLPAEDDPNGWIRAALLHALRDINDGFVTIGPEGATGYGRAQVRKIKLEGAEVNFSEIPAVLKPSEDAAQNLSVNAMEAMT